MKVDFNIKKNNTIGLDEIKDEHFILICSKEEDGRDGRGIYTVKKVYDNDARFNPYVGVCIKSHSEDTSYFCKIYCENKKTYIQGVKEGNPNLYDFYAFNTYNEWLEKLNELSAEQRGERNASR